MRGVLILLLVTGLAASGCLVDAEEPVHAYEVLATFEPSMLPNFGKDAGPFYRLVQVHQHVMPSPEQEREWNQPGGRGRVVCFRLDGVTPATMLGEASVDSEKPRAEAAMADSAASRVCYPTLDPGRGRLFANATEFDRLAPMGVAVLDPCSGSFLPLQSDEPGFIAQAPAYAFRTEFLANDTLLVDGRWHLQPGRTLKVEYVAAGPKAGSDDDRRVKVVFDYAGYWLVSNVGELVPGEEVLPPRPEEGNGPEAWIPRQPERLADVLSPLAEEAPESSASVAALRLTGLHGSLTDVRVTLRGDQTVEWFVAGGNETHLRMLGSINDAVPGSTTDRSAFVNAFMRFDLTDQLAGSDQAIDIQWRPDLALKSRMPVAWSETWTPSLERCKDGCSWVWTGTPTEEATWRNVPDPLMVQSEDALTLTVSVTHDGAAFVRDLYHVPKQG